jgi:hypothetical protein
LESSRCSCSLCSSQGAGRYTERWWSRRGDVHAAPADRRKAAMEAAPSKRNSDDR